MNNWASPPQVQLISSSTPTYDVIASAWKLDRVDGARHERRMLAARDRVGGHPAPPFSTKQGHILT
jgi:hypothetical protein